MPQPQLDAVLPVTRKDLPRARLLFRTLAPRMPCLGTLYVVAPIPHLDDVKAACRDVPLNVEVLAETTVVPELTRLGHLRGWFKQQLVKLAIAERVETDFYLTLDADVLCTRAVTYDGLLILGEDGKRRAPVALLPDTHPDWYRASVATLGLEPPRSGHLHNVTPALLSRSGVQALLSYLEQKASTGSYAKGLRGLKQRAAMAYYAFAKPAEWPLWRLFLGASTPWTEYALYYTFLEATGRYEEYHFDSSDCVYAVGESVWYADRAKFSDWDPAPLFDGEGAPFFAIVQSITGIDPSEVERKIAPYL